MDGITPEVKVKHWIGYSLVGIIAVWTAFSLSVVVRDGIAASYKAICGVSAERKQAEERKKIRADLQKKYAGATFISDFKQKTRLEFELNRASQVEENPDLEVNEESLGQPIRQKLSLNGEEATSAPGSGQTPNRPQNKLLRPFNNPILLGMVDQAPKKGRSNSILG